MAKPPRPTHYKVICISMYVRDIEELEAKVDALKARGWTRANKSQLIRLALAQLDVTTLEIPSGEDGSAPPARSAAPRASRPKAAARRITLLPTSTRLPPLSSESIARARWLLPPLTAIAATRALQSEASASLRA